MSPEPIKILGTSENVIGIKIRVTVLPGNRPQSLRVTGVDIDDNGKVAGYNAVLLSNDKGDVYLPARKNYSEFRIIT